MQMYVRFDMFDESYSEKPVFVWCVLHILSADQRAVDLKTEFTEHFSGILVRDLPIYIERQSVRTLLLYDHMGDLSAHCRTAESGR